MDTLIELKDGGQFSELVVVLNIYSYTRLTPPLTGSGGAIVVEGGVEVEYG